MPIVRKQLKPSDVYPEDIRYVPETDQVQRLVNGEWKNSPESDPRHQTTVPPRTTTDTRCDAAQSVTDAFHNQIDQLLTAIDNSGTAFTIAGIILSLFTFGPFGVFISIALVIANAMLDAGTTALEAALTPEAYDDMMCALYCQMDGSGRITAEGLGNAEAEITDKVGGLGAVILNAMLSLAGDGGVNNLAALGVSTGDCADCNCGVCTFDGDLALFFGSDLLPSDIHDGWWMATATLQGDGSYYIGVDLTTGTPNHAFIRNLDLNGNSAFPAGNQVFWEYPCVYPDSGCYVFGFATGSDVTGFYIRCSDSVAPIHFQVCVEDE